jgi:hypothetical protein
MDYNTPSFNSLIRCVVCTEITENWKGVKNPYDKQIYVVCLDCEYTVTKGIKVIKNTVMDE